MKHEVYKMPITINTILFISVKTKINVPDMS